MEKVAIVLMITMLLLTGCYSAEEGINTTVGDNAATLVTEPEKTITAHSGQTEEKYSLDLEYEQEIQACKSNAEMTETNNLYAQKWYNLSETYCANMRQAVSDKEYFDKAEEEYHQNKAGSVEIIHKNWKEYAQQRCKDEETRLLSVYTTGSIVPVRLSRFRYELYRDHAIEMYNMCREMFVDCPMP